MTLGTSWSSIEYGGKLKIAHYYMKHVFSNLLASPYLDYDNKTFNVLIVLSEFSHTYEGEIIITIHPYDSFEENLREFFNFTIERHSSQLVYTVPISELEERSKCKFNSTYSCVIKVYYNPLNDPDNDNGDYQENFFLMNNQLANVENLKTPTIEFKVNKLISKDNIFLIELNSTNVALFVYLDFETTEFMGKFSDNGFIMTEPIRIVTFTPKDNQLIDIEFFKKQLRVHSLMNIYKSAGSAIHSTKYTFIVCFFIFYMIELS